MRVTKKPWFGPKRYMGWGWSPASWEGWVVTAIVMVLVVASVFLFHGAALLVAIAVLLVVNVGVVLLTGDPPGGAGGR